MKLTGLTSYDKKTKRAVFEVIVPGTGSRKRIRKVVYVDGWDDLQEKLKAFRDAVKHPDREVTPPTAIPTLHEYKSTHWESYASRLSREKRRSDEAILKLHLLPILGNTRIDKITTAHVEDVIAAMTTAPPTSRSASQKPISAACAIGRDCIKTYSQRGSEVPRFVGWVERSETYAMPRPHGGSRSTAPSRRRTSGPADSATAGIRH